MIEAARKQHERIKFKLVYKKWGYLTDVQLACTNPTGVPFRSVKAHNRSLIQRSPVGTLKMMECSLPRERTNATVVKDFSPPDNDLMSPTYLSWPCMRTCKAFKGAHISWISISEECSKQHNLLKEIRHMA